VGLWDGASHYHTIDFPDVNEDGKADVCGRGIAGIYCALSNGTSFGSTTLWSAFFSNDADFDLAPYFLTIRYPDVDGDGLADVCGRHRTGIFCAKSTGTAFGTASRWSSFFSDSPGGWGDVKYFSTIAFPDINADGKADVCGRASTGMMCATSTGSGFTTPTLWEGTFSDAGGFGVEQYYSTITFPHINTDGLPDICGRGAAGLYCGFSTGSSFTPVTLFETTYSSAGGWDQPDNYKTLRVGNLDSDGASELCGRGNAGIHCTNFF
jgi:hypothetical protein